MLRRPFSAPAIASDHAWRGSRRLSQPSRAELQRRCRKGTFARPLAVARDVRPGTAMAVRQSLPPSHPPRVRIAPRAKAARRHTTHAPASIPRRPRAPRRSAVSRALEQFGLNLFPGNYVGRISLEPFNAGIKLSALSVSQAKRVSFEALPHFIQQLRLLGSC